jgi:hypothetical protein
MAAPAIAKIGTPPMTPLPPGKQIACLLRSAVMVCSHGRKPSQDGTLQVVAPALGDNITMSATIAGTCGEHPRWTVTGSTQAVCKGTKAVSRAACWRCGKWWAADSGSQDYQVTVASCSGQGHTFLIQAYPADSISIDCDLTKISEAFDDITTAIRFGLSAVVEEPDKPFDFELLKGEIEFSANWQEYDQDYRAFWKYYLALKFDPLLGVQGEATLPFVPPGISLLANACLFADLTGEIDASVQWGQLDPDKLTLGGDVKGEVDLTVGARLSLMDKKVLVVEASGSTGMSLDITPEQKDKRPWLHAELDWEGLKADVEVEVLWGLASLKYEFVVWEPKTVKSWDWDPIEALEPYIPALNWTA